jgi:hypothetical protein
MVEQSIDLKQIERKVWTSFFEDGIWDIYLGILLLAMAVGALLTDIGVPESKQLISYGCFFAVAFLFLWAGKHFITTPRIGRVRFGPKGKSRIGKAVVISALSVVVGLVAFILVSRVVEVPWLSGLPMDVVFPGIWIGNMLILFSLAAYFLHFHRLYLIGVMFAVTVPLDILLRELTHHDLSFVAFGLPAVTILIIGFIVLVRFIKKYPVVKERTFDVKSET